MASLEGKIVVIGGLDPQEPCPEMLMRDPHAKLLEVSGKWGQVLTALEESEGYLVETFDADLVRVAEQHLSVCEPSSPSRGGPGGFDAAAPGSADMEDAFVQAVVGALLGKGYCVVQMVTRPSARKAALFAAEDSTRWERPVPEFECAFMGRSPSGKRVLWLRDVDAGRQEGPGEGEGAAEDEGLGLADQLLLALANLVIPESRLFGFAASGRTNGMVHMACSEDEEEELLEREQRHQWVASKELDDYLAFSKRRKVCMMYFVHGSGGTLTLHPLEHGAEDIVLPCEENKVVLFRHDIMDYTFSPKGRQLAVQAWVLRERHAGESGLQDDLADDAVLDQCKTLPEGPRYRNSEETVDVTSLACRLSGGTWGPEHFWNLLSAGCDSVISVPAARWDHDLYYSDTPGTPGKGYVKHFGFLDIDQLATFDNDFFGYKPEEAGHLDPVQRTGLEVSYDCLFRAGWSREKLKGSEMAMCFAYAGSEWVQASRRGAYGSSNDLFLENSQAACASRLNYLFGITGPTTTVETACSSSLMATAMVHGYLRPVRPDALKASMRKQVSYGLSAGMHSYFDPFYTIGLCGASMLTHQGRCFTFDGSADGFVRGEGYMAMHYRVSHGEDLSRLAMLCGSYMNQDGRSASLTAPNGPSQQDCIRHSLREAGIRALDIQIQELHGTGTPLGDPIEVGALRATMMASQGVIRELPLIKTSAKSNIGHTELSAGGTGIMKCVLMGLYCAATPNAHLRGLNPHIDTTGYPVSFASEFVDQGKDTGYHGVSSFGFGGSNARGDVWVRSQAGPRNTQPGRGPLQLGAARLALAERLAGGRCVPRGGERGELEAAVPEADSGFSGSYFMGDPADDDMSFSIRGSFNAWGSAEKMVWDPELRVHSFAFQLGEARVEQFQLHCEGYGDVFPASKMAAEDELVLGPGKAPLGHTWVIDGRDDQVPQGTVYVVTLKWDRTRSRKRITWMPTVEEHALEMAASTVFRHRYFVSASWSMWKPVEMQVVHGEPGAFEAAVRIGLSGLEAFQLQRDRDPLQVIYPARTCEIRGKYAQIGPSCWGGSVPVRGPDQRGAGKHWVLKGDTGDRIHLRLQVVDGDITVSVSDARGQRTWRSLPGACRRSYFVCASWAGWGFLPMEPDPDGNPDVHRIRFVMTEEGYEGFHIVVDEDLEQAIYPEMQLADQGLSAALGPDGKGKGLHWGVAAPAGADVEITLDLSQADPRHLVTWRVDPPQAMLGNA